LFVDHTSESRMNWFDSG